MRAHALLFSVFMLSACGMDSPEDVKPRATHSANAAPSAKSADTDWQLIFSDEFNDQRGFNTDKWSHCTRGDSAWNKYVTATSSYASQTSGHLVLRMDDAVIAGDNVPYHSGCIGTADKFSFTYGKVEVRAKFNQGQGSWPAIWMLPEDEDYGDWPKSGELDLMEHLNNENQVLQSVINAETIDKDRAINGNAPFNIGDFNTYALEWSPTDIKYYVNGSLNFTYHKPANATSREWPFDKPFYLILDEQGEGWAGPINKAHLPFLMEVDYVRVYQRPAF